MGQQMTKTVLLTLGRLPKALELARSFKLAGWRVIIAEPFSWHVARLSRSVDVSRAITAPVENRKRYLEDLLKIVSDFSVDLIVPVSEESMYVAALHGDLPAGVHLFAPSQETLLRLHNKHDFIELATSYGLPVPQTAFTTSLEAETISRNGAHVIKPVFSCSGKGVRIVEHAARLAVEDTSNSIIVQQYVPGQVYSSFSIASQGQVLISVIYKGTVMSGTVSVAFERVAHLPTVTGWIDQFVARSNYSGFISFDFVDANNGTAYAIECNPRMTSGAHFVHPDDLARAIVDPLCESPVRFKTETQFQQFYPCLTEAQKSVFRPLERREKLKYLMCSKDVVWRANDPLPFLLMPLTSYKILALSIFQGLSFGEAATRDIEWTPAS
jgi:predicted ATP-grasp superfamily ATP-dependent carboligase